MFADGYGQVVTWTPERPLDEGCAFEELISFHGRLGGPQTRPFLLYRVELPAPEQPIIGAAQVHAVLAGWRRDLQGDDAVRVTPAAATALPV